MTITEAEARVFYQLFKGREDVAFIDAPNKTPRQVKTRVDVHEGIEKLVQTHLNLDQSRSRGSVGIYPLRDGTDCRWICSDFDDENAKEYAVKLANCWLDFGIQAWVESSRSKGYHVWVFIDKWCPGIIARRAALWVHQVADVPAVEVNPKQEITDGYGNCVRLPYWGGRAPGRMEIMDTYMGRPVQRDPHANWGLSNWIEMAIENRTSPSDLKALAVKWQPPVVEERTEFEGRPAPVRNFDGETTDLECRDVYRGNRMVPVGGRDDALFAVANYMRAIGLEEGEAIQVMTEIWNDQVEQSSSDVYMLRTAVDKVRRVYATR